MSESLLKLLSKQRKQVIGLMSGTSGDGLDCALVDVSGHGLDIQIHGVRSRTFPYDSSEKAFIHSLFEPEPDTAYARQAPAQTGNG